jgi:hypothetical protein
MATTTHSVQETTMTVIIPAKPERAYPELKGTDRVEEVCGGCGGTGVYQAPSRIMWQKHYTDTGRSTGLVPWCFDCNGNGKHSVLVSSVRARQTRDWKQAVKLAEMEAERPAREAAERAAAEVEAHAENDKRNAAIQAEADRRANTPAIPTEGRQQVTGTVVARYTRESQWGTSYKMIVEDDRGFKVCGAEPSNIYPGKGDRVRFMAALEVSQDDPTFGFYSRPTKAEILEEVSA